MNKPYSLSTVVLCIASFACTAAVLFAGSPGYGPISEVWKYISVLTLLAVSFGLLMIASSNFHRGTKLYGLKTYVVPALFLALSALPFTFTTILVVLKAGGIGG